MCILGRMDCNSLLISSWEWLLVLWLLDLFFLHIHIEVMQFRVTCKTHASFVWDSLKWVLDSRKFSPASPVHYHWCSPVMWVLQAILAPAGPPCGVFSLSSWVVENLGLNPLHYNWNSHWQDLDTLKNSQVELNVEDFMLNVRLPRGILGWLANSMWLKWQNFLVNGAHQRTSGMPPILHYSM